MSVSTVLVTIHAPTVPLVSERRLPSDVPVRTILLRLELLSGIPPESQKLSLWSARTDDPDCQARLLRECNDANTYAKSLKDLGVQDGMCVKVEDTRSGTIRDQFGTEEEEKVEKYEMDDEAYAKRDDSVLAYKQRNKMGRFGSAATQNDKQATEGDLLPASIQVGARCEVDGGRRGAIRYAGATDFATGSWVGVEYDEPVGKNDGSIAEKRYFTCKAKYGGFVRAEKVKIGNYPERGLMGEEEDDDEEEEM
ncbi:hypothetical protein CBS101457_002373 [Exobasidium rhododendri]|nr:hypothetical protein CBS101457_002373 [Exobasidium rhododendri]